MIPRFTSFLRPLRLAQIAIAALITWLVLRPPPVRYYFDVIVATETSARVKVYADLGAGFSETDSVGEDITAGRRLVRLPLPFGSYRRLRFDPIDHGGTLTFRRARIIDVTRRTVRRFSFRDFQPNTQVEQLTEQPDESTRLVAKAGANDPHLTVDFAPPLTLSASRLRLWLRMWPAVTGTFAGGLLGLWCLEQLWRRVGVRVRTAFSALRQTLLARPAWHARVTVAFLIATAFMVLAWRQHRFVDDYAVNMMSWDQWDFYQPLFKGEGWWATFVRQHGPHRQGVGFIVTRVLATCSHWNSRWDAFAVSWALIAAAALALWLARRCGARLHVALVAVPLLFLNARQHTAIIGAANLSHGAMPMLLFVLYGLSWFVPRPPLRLALLCGLTFLLIFTGFGLFVGLLPPLLFAAEAVHAFRARRSRQAALAVAALACVGLSWLAFAHGYGFQPAVPNFRFPYEKPWEYFEFAALMLTNFFGLRGYDGISIAVGLFVLFLVAIVGVWHGTRCFRFGPDREPRSTVIFCFAGFALLFCANTAAGRVFLGMDGTAAPRYVTLLIPAGFALFLHLSTWSTERRANWLALGFALLLVPGTVSLRDDDQAFARTERDGRKSWKAAYLATRDEKKADAQANFQVYPGSVAERLRFLEERRLNLFNLAGVP